MKKVTLIIFLLLITISGYSQTKNFIDQPYLETNASVDTLVVPDKIYLSILITEKDTKGKIAVEELEQKMNIKLKSLGIDTKEQLFLSDAASNFKRYFLKKKDVLKNKAYTLIVYDALTAGKVIVGLESIEISNINLIKTEFSKIEELKLELKQKAIIKAKTQAEMLLKPLNQKLGRAIHISDLSNYNNNQYLARNKGYELNEFVVNGSINQPIDIEFQKIKIQSTIGIKFSIE
ncbi:DUF541 domain-containing protein [Flavobacteriaceae bacterium AU392]|nr:SIMPL domain-containing protein [Flavobacteriaceae bacterium]RKM81227.1 DUF541 domain-containing protein [Flavobacteriaceae bacterium AU392]